MRFLFILKRRPDFNPEKHTAKGLSTGLFNSATFMEEMLQTNGIEAGLEVARDNNDIDRMVHQYKPSHVILEALWVVPTKFAVLTKLHPKVKWIVRLHSELPFIASEGMAMDWLGEYLAYSQISIGVNAPRMLSEVRSYLRIKGLKDLENRVFYLPNYYPLDVKSKKFEKNKDTIDISCFGAIRPLKNHLSQAVAALIFADKIGKKLRFHINSGRIEMKGDPIHNNLRGMFQQLHETGHEMVAHEWCPRDDFLKICAAMDIGMQCNFSETFNIVGADLITQGVPLLTSKEIPWAAAEWNGDPTDTSGMVNLLEKIYDDSGRNVLINQFYLKEYSVKSEKTWMEYCKEQK